MNSGKLCQPTSISKSISNISNVEKPSVTILASWHFKMLWETVQQFVGALLGPNFFDLSIKALWVLSSKANPCWVNISVFWCRPEPEPVLGGKCAGCIMSREATWVKTIHWDGELFLPAPKFQLHRYEEDCILCACVFHALCGHFSRACFLVRHGIEERLKILGSPNQEGKWKDDERPLREKHFFHCVRATSHNEITKMKGANLPLISFSKTSKWKHTEFENGNLHIICTLSTNSIYTNSDLNFRIGGWWSSQFWQCQNFESSSYWNMSLMMKKCSRTY